MADIEVAKAYITAHLVDTTDADLAKIRGKIAATKPVGLATKAESDVTGLEKHTGAANEAAAAEQKLGNESETAGKKAGNAASGGLSMSTLASAAIVVGLAEIGTKSVEAADTYENSTVQMGINAHETEQQANQLGDTFLATGGKSEYSAQQLMAAYSPVAGLLTNITGQALSNADATKVMQAAQNAAYGTGQDLANVTDGLAKVMVAYHLNASQAAQASDVLTNTSLLTNTSIGDLAGAVDKLHAKLGVNAPSLQDTATLVASFNAHGITGSKGLMMVNSAMSTLQGGSKSTKTELDNLGVKIYDANGKFVGMQDVISQLSPKLSKMTDQQRQAAEAALFGKGAAGAMNGIIQDGLPGWDQLSAKVGAAGGAQEDATRKGDTFKGQMDKLKGAVSDAGVQFGKILIPILKDVAKFFTAVIVPVMSFLATHPKLVAAIGLIAGAIAGLVLGIKIWTAVTKLLSLTILGTPIGWIMLAIAALIAIVVVIISNWSHITGFFHDLWAGVVDIFKAAIDFIINYFKNWLASVELLWKIVSTIFMTGVHAVVGFFTDLWHDIESIWNSITGWVSGAIDKVIGFFTGMPSRAGKVWDWIKEGLKDALNAVVWMLNKGVDAINTILHGINWASGLIGIPAIPDIPHIPKLAAGGVVTKGGLVTTSEKGAETIALPTGAAVYPHGSQPAGTGETHIHVHVAAVNIKAMADLRNPVALDSSAREYVVQLNNALRNLGGQFA